MVWNNKLCQFNAPTCFGHGFHGIRQGVSLQKCLIGKSTLVSVHPCSTADASSSASVVRFRKQLAVMIYHWHCGCWLLNMLVTGAEPMEV